MRLIDADVMKDMLEFFIDMLEFFIELIDKHPIIEPERKKGHINIHNHIEYCSECGKSLGIGYTNYCGYCGAELEVK